MQTQPGINWSVAGGIAGPISGDLPPVGRPEALELVASLRLAAKRAGELAAVASRLPGVPASQVVVSDRETWAKGASVMVGGILGTLPLAQPSPSALGSLRAAGYGALAGIALGRVGAQLLGQFDPATSRLFLLAPNILSLQRARGFVMQDFQLWVAAHEQTHALQFSAAPWLMEYLTARFAQVATDEMSAVDVARNLARGQGLAAAMASPQARRAMEEISATMTLLEGHADFVSDRVGSRHIATVKKLRRAFARAHPPTAMARFMPALDKDAQYRDGLKFCRKVVARAGIRTLGRAFESPEDLPSSQEIAEPEAWVRRVRGSA